MELTKTNNGQWKPGQSGNLQGRPGGSRAGRGKILHVADLRHAHSLERVTFKMFMPNCFDEMSQRRLMICCMGMGAEIIRCAP
jgi:hypothetical protein